MLYLLNSVRRTTELGINSREQAWRTVGPEGKLLRTGSHRSVSSWNRAVEDGVGCVEGAGVESWPTIERVIACVVDAVEVVVSSEPDQQVHPTGSSVEIVVSGLAEVSGIVTDWTISPSEPSGPLQAAASKLTTTAT